MNRARRIILPIVMAVILTFITCIPIFAYNKSYYYIDHEPSDLGNETSDTYIPENQLVKYYIKLNNLTTVYVFGNTVIGQNATDTNWLYLVTANNNILTLTPQDIVTEYCYMIAPVIEIDITDVTDVYVPIYCYNIKPYTMTPGTVTIYTSTTTDENKLMREYYEIGYAVGYDNGLSVGQNIEQYTNITGYVTNLLSKFVGSEYAEYLTPISIVLVILMVYFLFIRFLLSLIKAKGVLKTCDIIMITACIILLVIMYAPKLNLTIKTEQVASETTSTLNRNVEEVKTREYETIHTETGDIWVGPAGTILFPDVETTDSGQRATESVDVSTSTKGERE